MPLLMRCVRGLEHFQSLFHGVIYSDLFGLGVSTSNITWASTAFYHPHLDTVMSASDSRIEGRLKSREALPIDFQGNRVSIFDAIEKKRIWRKIDIHLLPSVSLLYLLSYM